MADLIGAKKKLKLAETEDKKQWRRENRKNRRLLCAAFVLMLAIAFLSLFFGRYSLFPVDVIKIIAHKLIPESLIYIEPSWTKQMETVVFQIRLPRMLAALLIGASLAVSGNSYQALFRNPLVSPDLLGVSAGACVARLLPYLRTIAVKSS